MGHVDELADSSGVLHDSAVLRKRLAEAGYLFFRGLLPVGTLRAAGAAVAGTAARRRLDRRGRYAVRAAARAQLGGWLVGSRFPGGTDGRGVQSGSLSCAAARDGTADTRGGGVLLPGEGEDPSSLHLCHQRGCDQWSDQALVVEHGALLQLVAAACQVGRLGGVARQRDGSVVRRPRLLAATQSAQDVGSGREVRRDSQPTHPGDGRRSTSATSGPSSSAIATARLRATIGDGSRRGELIVEGHDLRPVGVANIAGRGVHSVDRGQDLVAAWGLACGQALPYTADGPRRPARRPRPHGPAPRE